MKLCYNCWENYDPKITVNCPNCKIVHKGGAVHIDGIPILTSKAAIPILTSKAIAEITTT